MVTSIGNYFTKSFFGHNDIDVSKLVLANVLVVTEFQNMFDDDCILPLVIEVEFNIELLSSIAHIYRSQYQMSLIELVEIKK